MSAASRQHLEEAGISYAAHRRRAWRIGSAMTAAGLACIVHGLFPSIFKTTASKTVVRLNREIMAGPGHRSPPALVEFEI